MALAGVKTLPDPLRVPRPGRSRPAPAVAAAQDSSTVVTSLTGVNVHDLLFGANR